MARKRQQNPNPIKAKVPEDWWDVQFMDVESHLSKSGNTSIRVDYSVDEREFPVSVYYSPDHANEFARKRWRRFKEEMAKQGHEIKGKKIDSIVELSADWMMPDRIGVIISEDGEFENIDVVALDWGDEGEEEEENGEEEEEDDGEEEEKPKAKAKAKAKRGTVKKPEPVDDNELPF